VKDFHKAVALVLTLTLAAGLAPLAAQVTAGTESTVPGIEFPQWSRDLRRAEIVAFGMLPFSWIISTITMDLSRTIAHNGDQQYWPWPLKPAGAPTMTNSEFIASIGIAAGISLTVAVVDYIIITRKRKKAEMLKFQNPRGEPIIIRRPVTDLDDETVTPPNSDAGAVSGQR
jgi:hypothetical protein